MGNTLQEMIKKALEEGNLEQMMSVIKMEAAKQNVQDDVLEKMVKSAREAFELERKKEENRIKEEKLQHKAAEAASKNKYIIGAICTALVVLEWILIFNAHPAEGESNHFFLTLIVNIITLLAVVICAAMVFRKKN